MEKTKGYPKPSDKTTDVEAIAREIGLSKRELENILDAAYAAVSDILEIVHGNAAADQAALTSLLAEELKQALSKTPQGEER